jgi:hypothetical protein
MNDHESKKLPTFGKTQFDGMIYQPTDKINYLNIKERDRFS